MAPRNIYPWNRGGDERAGVLPADDALLAVADTFDGCFAQFYPFRRDGKRETSLRYYKKQQQHQD